MIVELISIGTELLLGNIVNTNAAYLAEKCAELGLSCHYQTVVGDREEHIGEALRAALVRADVVICSGGMGHKEENKIKEIACRMMVENDNKRKKAVISSPRQILVHDNGTASGIILESSGKILIMLPGSPSEMEPMFEEQVSPYLQKRQPEVICSTIVKICGNEENDVVTAVRDLIDTQTNPAIAVYAKTGEVHLRLTAKASTEVEAKKRIRPVRRELKKRFGDAIYTEKEEETLEMAVVKILKKKKLTLTTVESCTGGAIAARIVNVPGASEVLMQGFVTYSNEAKHKLVGVKKKTLKEFGAVSSQTAAQMAKGGCKVAGSDVAISVTGIAGPGGGTKKKPVGLVYIACTCQGKTTVKELHLTGDRTRIREQSVAQALILIRESLL